MKKSVEDRLNEIEAKLKALTNLVLSDIVSTTDDGVRDIDGTFILAEGQLAAGVRDKAHLFAFHLGELISSIKDVRAAARDDLDG